MHLPDVLGERPVCPKLKYERLNWSFTLRTKIGTSRTEPLAIKIYPEGEKYELSFKNNFVFKTYTRN